MFSTEASSLTCVTYKMNSFLTIYMWVIKNVKIKYSQEVKNN